jgi:hypothetical protein
MDSFTVFSSACPVCGGQETSRSTNGMLYCADCDRFVAGEFEGCSRPAAMEQLSKRCGRCMLVRDPAPALYNFAATSSQTSIVT